MYKVYVITNILDGKKFIGIEHRTKQILNIHNEPLNNDVKKFGKKNFKKEIVFTSEYIYKAREYVKNHINKYKYNIISYKNKKSGKRVIMTKQGFKVKTFNSVTEAAKYVGGSKGNISSVCTGRHKSAYGFGWKYE